MFIKYKNQVHFLKFKRVYVQFVQNEFDYMNAFSIITAILQLLLFFLNRFPTCDSTRQVEYCSCRPASLLVRTSGVVSHPGHHRQHAEEICQVLHVS